MAEQVPLEVEPALSFDRFQVLPRQRLLLEAGKPVRIGSRAFDILIALLERRGARVGKADLLARAWPGLHVVEGNLKFQVAALRRALGDGQEGRRFIEASKGQGYCFVAPVSVGVEGERIASAEFPTSHHNLPAQMHALVGRDDVVARLTQQLATRRLLTIVGPSGIGKTAVALAVAERMIGACEDGVWVVDLALIADPADVCGAVAGIVGLEVRPGLTMGDLVAALRSRRMLLVLDNCMHVIDAAAALATAILHGAPGIRILATSREPLRCEGEHLCRFGPLDVPPDAERITASDALRYPSVELLVQLAAASLEGFQLSDEDAPLAAEICRKLDGIPLAIELAAAWVGVLGLRGLLAQLGDQLRLLTGGRRTALPRHRTMRAALDWSHDLLSPEERLVFRRLAVFVGGFTLDTAACVAADDALPAQEVVRLVLELAAKSLVVPELDTPGPRFRLLETTRAYALEKAAEAGEGTALARRHAQCLLDTLRAAAEAPAHGEETSSEPERDLDNVRAALSWAFLPEGDAALGVALAAEALPRWFSASLPGEAHAWTERAISALEAAGMRDTRQEMLLLTAYGISRQMVLAGTSEAHVALSRALLLAERLQDTEHRLHVLHALWIHHMRMGEVGRALDVGRSAKAVAASQGDPIVEAATAWMLGIALHFAGDHDLARSHLDGLLRDPLPNLRRRLIAWAGFDPYVTARYVLAHLLWVQGQPEHAVRVVRMALDEAQKLRHPVTLCSALAFGACPLSLLIGDLDDAERHAEDLVTNAEKHGLGDHLRYGRAALAIVSLRKASTKAGAEQVRRALELWRASQWHLLLGVSDFAEAAAEAGLAEDAARIVNEALEQSQRDSDFWSWPELLRVRGELLLRQPSPDARQARECFERALDRARAQGALAWQLRSATSLYRLDLAEGRARGSRTVLSEIIAQFPQGNDTHDLAAARRLLARRGSRVGPEASGPVRDRRS